MTELTPEQRELWRKEAGLGVCSDPRHEFGRDYRILDLLDALVVAEQMLDDERERIAQEIDRRRAEARTAFRQHNAGRDLSAKPPRRPDLDSWANAFEVAARVARGLA
jgi:hypothetical protein